MDTVMIKGSCKPLPKRTMLTNYLPWFCVPVNKVTHVFISESKSIYVFLKVNYLALWGKQYGLFCLEKNTESKAIQGSSQLLPGCVLSRIVGYPTWILNPVPFLNCLRPKTRRSYASKRMHYFKVTNGCWFFITVSKETWDQRVCFKGLIVCSKGVACKTQGLAKCSMEDLKRK